MGDSPHILCHGRYRIIRVLGEGAQATTFEAVDTTNGKAVAVKRFRVRGAGSWKEVELAEREARVLAGLSHPMLPRYLEHFEEGGELFLVTRKIKGESLASLRMREIPFGEDDVMRLLHDAADALSYLHGRASPIVHRDLKPSNILRRRDGSFAFIDFGAVRDRMKPEGGSTVVGTFGYMAPEQFQGRAMPASDVYAIGATALSLLTGRDPEDLPHKGLGIDVPAALAGRQVSRPMVKMLSAMLVLDPDKRAQSLAELLDRPSKKSRSRKKRPPPKKGRFGWLGAWRWMLLPMSVGVGMLAVPYFPPLVGMYTMFIAITLFSLKDSLRPRFKKLMQLMQRLTARSRVDPDEVEREEDDEEVGAKARALGPQVRVKLVDAEETSLEEEEEEGSAEAARVSRRTRR